METKKFIWLGIFIGSFVGGYIPQFWGAGMFSFSGIIFSSLGAIVGVWFGYRISH